MHALNEWVLLVRHSPDLFFQIVDEVPRHAPENFWSRTQKAIVSVARSPVGSVLGWIVQAYLL